MTFSFRHLLAFSKLTRNDSPFNFCQRITAFTENFNCNWGTQHSLRITEKQPSSFHRCRFEEIQKASNERVRHTLLYICFALDCFSMSWSRRSTINTRTRVHCRHFFVFLDSVPLHYMNEVGISEFSRLKWQKTGIFEGFKCWICLRRKSTWGRLAQKFVWMFQLHLMLYTEKILIFTDHVTLRTRDPWNSFRMESIWCRDTRVFVSSPISVSAHVPSNLCVKRWPKLVLHRTEEKWVQLAMNTENNMNWLGSIRTYA